VSGVRRTGDGPDHSPARDAAQAGDGAASAPDRQPDARRARAPTVADIAWRAGVSNAAVSYALNGRPGVSDEIRRRIVTIAEDLGYRPNRLATGLRRGRTRVLGLLLADLTNPFYPDIASGIIGEAAARGYQVFVSSSGLDGEMFASELAALRDHRCDGLIFTSLVDSHRLLLEDTIRSGVPCVQVTRRLAQVEADFVGIDDYRAAVEVGHYVAQAGFRRPAILNGPAASSASRARLAGYRDGLAANGITPLPHAEVDGALSVASGYRRATPLLAARSRPDVVICGDDMIALGAIDAASEQGLAVPDDLAIFGYDDMSFAASSSIQLSTVSVPRAELGATAVRTLLARLENPAAPIHEVLLPHSLAIRRTCSAPLPPAPGGKRRRSSPRRMARPAGIDPALSPAPVEPAVIGPAGTPSTRPAPAASDKGRDR
jgi:LacI family transcriptional regulator